MIAAIIQEICLIPAGEVEIATIYFGGGTPSILDMDDLQIILDTVQKKFIIDDDAEITLEANPDDISAEKLVEWRSAGVNRLSVGIQSFFDEELQWMNRAHTAEESLQCIENIMEGGITNFSVDLIYGSPLLTDDQWKRNMDIVIKRNIPHVSCYALTVEPRTALDKMIITNKSAPIDAAKQARQFELLMERTETAGYEHYEISNFAKPGMRSRHNSSYWTQTPAGQNKKYIGIGPSAHSFDGIKRSWNIANNALYVQSVQKGIIPFEEEILTQTQQLNEYILTSLRTMEGLDLDHVRIRFGENFSNDLLNAGKKYIATNKLVTRNLKLILTKEGKLFADGIAADLFF